MAKNRAAANKFNEKKDHFFKKTGSKFSNPKLRNKNNKEKVKPAPSSDSNNFFIKTNHTETSNEPETSKAHNSQEGSESQVNKRPFDKKQYRLQKYSKKYQIQQWENKRKKAILHNYYKTVKDEPSNLPKKIYEEYNTDSDDDDDNEKDKSHDKQVLDTTESIQSENSTAVDAGKGKRSKPFRKAHEEFQRLKEEKAKQKEQFLKQKIERKEAMEANKKKRIETYKKLNKKTKRGQPVMKDRIEMLLERIQNSINQS